MVSFLTDEEYQQLTPNGRLLADITEAELQGDEEKADLLRQKVLYPAEALMALKRSRGEQIIKDWN